MKSVLAALATLGLMALSGAAMAENAAPPPAAAPAAPVTRFDASYSAIARGIDAGRFNYHFSQNGPSYEITAERRLTGMARMFMGESQDFSYSVRGAIGPQGRLQPAAYQHSGGTRHRIVRVSFNQGQIVTTAEPRMGMGHPPATEDQKRGAVDQLTALATLMTTTGDPCSQTVRVYMDGRSRFDFVLSPNGQVNANSTAYRGRAVRCRVQFVPIAGFSDPQEAATLTFLFARTPSGFYAPIVVEMPSDDVGIIRLEARSLSINGRALR